MVKLLESSRMYLLFVGHLLSHCFRIYRRFIDDKNSLNVDEFNNEKKIIFIFCCVCKNKRITLFFFLQKLLTMKGVIMFRSRSHGIVVSNKSIASGAHYSSITLIWLHAIWMLIIVNEYSLCCWIVVVVVIFLSKLSMNWIYIYIRWYIGYVCVPSEQHALSVLSCHRQAIQSRW